MTPADSGAAAHVFVDDLEGPILSHDDRHHLVRVLRLRPGADVTVSDGSGHWRLCRLGDELEPAGPVHVATPPEPALTIAIALVKGERPELVVQKLTELGVDRVVLFPAARSVVRWDGGRAARHLERLRGVARSAAMQSRRAVLPIVELADGFAAVSGLPGAVLAERGGDPPTLDRPTVLIGPEGGWDDGERALGLPHMDLGAGVLRAETAAIAAGAVLTALRGRLINPQPGQTRAP